MLKLLLVLLSTFVQAEELTVLSVEYRPAPQSVSCGLLHQRELERLKVARELAHMINQTKKRKSDELLMSGNLITNKLFMPEEVWQDLSADVLVTAKISDSMLEEMDHSNGLPFIAVQAPGFVWASYTDQLPEGMSIELNRSDRVIEIRYPIYLNVLCSTHRAYPTVEWLPSDRPVNDEEGQRLEVRGQEGQLAVQGI